MRRGADLHDRRGAVVRLLLRYEPLVTDDRMPEREVEVEYRQRLLGKGQTGITGRSWHAYDLFVDGELVGYVEEAGLPIDGRGRALWKWTRLRPDQPPEPQTSRVYAGTRHNAVARLLGYHRATEVLGA
jgi:hypothetical protein